MSVVQFSEALKATIEAGQTVVEGNVVRVIADNGAEIGEAVKTTVIGGNGVGATVYTMVKSGKTAGLAFMTVDLGVAGAAIAPALGVVAGAGLYALAPSFWDSVAEALMNAGETIGKRVIAYFDGDNIYFNDGTIETIKQMLVDADFFYGKSDSKPAGFPELVYPQPYNVYTGGSFQFEMDNITFNHFDVECSNVRVAFFRNAAGQMHMIFGSESPITVRYIVYGDEVEGNWQTSTSDASFTFNDKTIFYSQLTSPYSILSPIIGNVVSALNIIDAASQVAWLMFYDMGTMPNPDTLQPGATYPDDDPFPLRYPEWYPFEYPETVPNPSELPKVYPLKYPETEPDPYPKQDPAQNPDPESVPDTYPYVIPDLPLPDPTPDPDIPTPPEPTPPDPDPDPDPQPVDPDEPIIPDPDIPPTPDPVDPNIPPTPTPIIPDPVLPTTVQSSKLFTVYNPTGGQLDSLGAYLWDSSLMASLRDIWQDPLDGIISLIQVYATPVTSGSHNIILGYLDSGVSSAVVSNQFVTIDCGSVTVKETKYNATDYAPYTSMHLFLPFIGMVELDVNECMKSTIKVIYKVDVYTGTCLAQVKITRTKDMPNSPILYTYSGNCAQQIPLTSGNATGMLSALIGGVTAGLSVASGGGLGVLAGASIAGHSLTHDMFHVSHSGNISANAGIMGNKKPYLVIGRRHGYDANNYSAFYGYPANKTITLGNHNGYAKIKKCWLKSKATKPEQDEILSLLSEGVIL